MFDFEKHEPVDFYLLPDDKGQKLYHLIGSATDTIDIVVYDIYAKDILEVLSKAKGRGVDICVIIKSQYTNNDFSTNPKFKFVFDFIDALEKAPGSGQVNFQWSSNNFFLTHQKTVLIDARKTIKETSRVLIATHNLANYSIMKNPDLCFWEEVSPTSEGGHYTLIRNAGFIFDDDEIISRIMTVFNYDKSCSSQVIDMSSDRYLVWSNGSLLKNKKKYPEQGVYVKDGSLLTSKDVGNSSKAIILAIEAAKKSLYLSSESFSSPFTTNALCQAAERGLDVRLILPKSVAQHSTRFLDEMYKAGVKIKVAESIEGGLYMHIKQMLVDVGTKDSFALSGSLNLSTASIRWNRELSVFLKGSVVKVLEKTYQNDWELKYMKDYNPDFFKKEKNQDTKSDFTAYDNRYSYLGEIENLQINTGPSIPCGPIIRPNNLSTPEILDSEIQPRDNI